MESIHKRIVFHFYTFEDFKNNRANQLHLKCLKRYSNVFNDAIFVISLDDISNVKLIRETQDAILDCGFLNIKFIIKKNDSYREAKTFYEEIILKMKDLYGLTFFGHNKGTTNYATHPDNKDDIDAWIVGLYYFNLNFIEEVKNETISNCSCFYGAFLHVNPRQIEDKEVPGGYSGTFYWINCSRLYNKPFIEKKFYDREIDIFPPISDRYYAEQYPTLMCSWDNGWGLSSHGRKVIFTEDLYHNASKALRFLSNSEEEYNEVKNLKN